MRTITAAERRTRLGDRHRLARATRSIEEAITGVVGLHSSDPVSVYLGAYARVAPFSTADLERCLYEDRFLVRTWAMRRTLFVVSREMYPTLRAASGGTASTAERRRLITMLTDQGITDDADAWLTRVEGAVLAALSERGEATARELREVVPELRRSLSFGEGRRWGGTMGVSTRVLFLLAGDGRIIRGRPLGSWTSSQYRWATEEAWFGEEVEVVDPVIARRGLVRRWLARFGPGTVADVKWWTGWTVRDTRAALEAVGAVEVAMDEGPGWILPDDQEPVDETPDWVGLLPGLDSTTMGWKDRHWYVGDHADQLFNRNGNAGPTVWWNGAVVGTWAQRSDGEIAVGLLEPVPTVAGEMIEHEAQRLERWLGAARITPRFRTPAERALLA